MKTTHYLLIYSLTLIFSCKEDKIPETFIDTGFDETKVNGIVVDYFTEEPIAGATVYHLVETGWSNYDVLETVISDSNGYFDFTNYDIPGENYYAYAEKENYYASGYLGAGAALQDGLEFDVEMKSKAWLQIHFQNIPPSDPSDHFFINGFVSDDFNGSDVDVTVTYEVVGNFNNTFYWEGDGTPGQFDTIYCPAFDTTYYEILY